MRADAMDWRAACGLNRMIESPAVLCRPMCVCVCGPRSAHDCVTTDAIYELVPSGTPIKIYLSYSHSFIHNRLTTR